MTSSGLKRPLEFESNSPKSVSGSSNASTSYGPVANGNKRRCMNSSLSPSPNGKSSIDSRSPFKESSTLLTTILSEDIASVIKDELHRTNNDQQSNGSEIPILTIRQTQTICERVIRDREQRLRDEYDKILACKIAEQHDLLTRASYLKSLETRMSSPIVPSATPSLSALAAACNVPRSVAPNSASSFMDFQSYMESLMTGHRPLTREDLGLNLQQRAVNASIQAHTHVASLPTGAASSGPVLLASNLDEQLATPEALFTLFGVFGDVVRVKILFNKKDNALIQMADANQAQVAQGYLDKQKVFGKVIRVTRSKHLLVQMPREGSQPDAGLTKDFTNSPLHRFKIPGSRNYSNIYPPSNTLHISNIPSTIEENGLKEAFREECGFQCSSFRFFPKDRKMALMRFSSIEQATIALIKMHNYQICSENNLRVSFSKSAPQQ